MLALFSTKTRKNTALEMKHEIIQRRKLAEERQLKHSPGTDFWNRYQWQINMLNDLLDTVNNKFNLIN